FKGAANFIAVDSGSDGLSPTPAIAQAGVAALLSIIRGDNAGKVENSANAALVKYSSAQTKKLPRGATASIPVNPLYNGDK
ncbi:hypothetical protein OFC41_32245, partial [Escherichia coli]|nr:hypothetical protein [Escherichia coli]